MHPMEAGSFRTGELPDGCKFCREGSKLVLLITGKCSHDCFYCPLSREKKGKDVIFANERPVDSFKDVLAEAEAMDAMGTGITGGDPVEVLDRTCEFIVKLKENFGENHHIHLYTPSFDTEKLEKLLEAGLDELRFHPGPTRWNEVGLEPYLEFIEEHGNDADLGFEVPVLPGKIEELSLLGKKAREAGALFINLNELEFSPTNLDQLSKAGYRAVDDIWTTVEGSRETAEELAKRHPDLPWHFCSSPFKDSVQLRNRLLRRAENSSLPYEVSTEDGTLLVGEIEIKGGMGQKAASILRSKNVDPRLFQWDDAREVLHLAPFIMEEVVAELGPMIEKAYISEVYASFDRLEVERIPFAMTDDRQG